MTESTLAEISGECKIDGGGRIMSHGTVCIDRDVVEALKARRWEASWEYTALKTRQMPDWTDESESERRPGGPAGRARTASGASCAESPQGATFRLRLSERTREVREIRCARPTSRLAMQDGRGTQAGDLLGTGSVRPPQSCLGNWACLS